MSDSDDLFWAMGMTYWANNINNSQRTYHWYYQLTRDELRRIEDYLVRNKTAIAIQIKGKNTGLTLYSLGYGCCKAAEIDFLTDGTPVQSSIRNIEDWCCSDLKMSDVEMLAVQNEIFEIIGCEGPQHLYEKKAVGGTYEIKH